MKGRMKPYLPELTIRDYNTYLRYLRGVRRQLYTEFGWYSCHLLRYNGVLFAILSDSLAGRMATCQRQRVPGTLCWRSLMCQTQGIRQAAQVELPAACFKAMRDNLAQLKLAYASENRERILDLDNEFHELVYKAAGKTWTFGIIKEQMVHYDRLRSLNIRVDVPENTIKDHEELIYALEKHDPELCDFLLNRHLNRYQLVKDTLLAKYPDYFV